MFVFIVCLLALLLRTIFFFYHFMFTLTSSTISQMVGLSIMCDTKRHHQLSLGNLKSLAIKAVYGSVRYRFSVFRWTPVVLSCFTLLNQCDVGFLCIKCHCCLWSVVASDSLNQCISVHILMDKGSHRSSCWVKLFIFVSCLAFSQNIGWLCR